MSNFSAREINPNTTALYKTEWIEVAEGKKIRLTTTDKDQQIANNDNGMIERIEGDTLHINLNGKIIIFQPSKEQTDRHIDYAYAITTYAYQGASIPYVIVYESNNISLTSMYIPMWNYLAQKSMFNFISMISVIG